MPTPFDHSPTDGPLDPCPMCAVTMSKADLLKTVKSLQAVIAGMTTQAVEHFDEEVRLTGDILTIKKQLADARYELETQTRLNGLWLPPETFRPGLVLQRKGLPRPEWGVRSIRSGKDAHDTLVCLVNQEMGNELWVRYSEIVVGFEVTASVLKR
jgi:hypothetical protein